MEFTMGGHPVDPGHKRGNPFGAKRDKLELDLYLKIVLHSS